MPFEKHLCRAPLVSAIAFVAFINWFVFFGISVYLGGDSIGVTPSIDGFVVKTHGVKTAVGKEVWLFSLFYPYFTLMFTPAAMLLLARYKLLANRATVVKWTTTGFICLWCVLWYGSITQAFIGSLTDYLNL
mgnify:CR=1 FL=1